MKHRAETETFLLGIDLGTAADRPAPLVARSAADEERRDELGQWFTPAWAAEILYNAHFSELTEKDMVWEPSVGTGAFLSAVPSNVRAIGSEIDPAMAQIAAARTGRPVVVGDFCTVPIPEDEITAIVGNIKFELSLLDKLLARSRFLPEGSKCGLLLPTYMFQTYGNVIRWNRDFCYTIEKEAIPRGLFPGIKTPLDFAIFTRDAQPHLIGFRLYDELKVIRDLPLPTQKLLSEVGNGSRSVWVKACFEGLRKIGGRGRPSDVCRALEENRPTDNPWWKEQVRKVLRKHFPCVGDATYALPAAA